VNNKLLIAFLSFLFTLPTFSQTITTYYDLQWKSCNKSEASYYSINKLEDSIWHREDFNMKTNSLQMVAYFKDSANKIYHGAYKSYYPNGIPNKNALYNNGLAIGIFLSFYPNGMIQDSIYFKNGIPVGLGGSWYANGNPKSESQMDTLGNGTGLAIGFFLDGTISFKGKLGNGLQKRGNWFYYHANGKKASVFQYSNEETELNSLNPQIKKDEFESIFYDSTINYKNVIYYDTTGVQIATPNYINSPAEFVNGIMGWAKYLEKKLASVADFAARSYNGIAIYVISFIVKTDGKVENVILDNTIDPKLDKYISDILLFSPKWKPAKHNNRIIAYQHVQSISLVLNQN